MARDIVRDRSRDDVLYDWVWTGIIALLVLAGIALIWAPS